MVIHVFSKIYEYLKTFQANDCIGTIFKIFCKCIYSHVTSTKEIVVGSMFIFIFICTIKDDEYSGRSMCNFSIVLLTNYWYFKIFYSVGTDFWLLLKLIQWDHKKKNMWMHCMIYSTCPLIVHLMGMINTPKRNSKWTHSPNQIISIPSILQIYNEVLIFFTDRYIDLPLLLGAKSSKSKCR